MRDQRAGGAPVKLGCELHFFGGVIRANGVYAQDYGTHWAFDLDGGTAWRTTTPDGQVLALMPNPRNHMGGVALAGKIYAIGGQHLGDEITGAQNEVDVYDPVTNTWTQVAPMPRPIGHITANVFVRNGHIEITSGVTSNSVEIANVIEYDPLTNTWSELPALPAARQSPVSGLIGDRIVVTSGSHSGLTGQTWITTPIGTLPTPWTDQDVGIVGVAGSAFSSNYSSSFSVTKSSTGIGSNADGFHYVYQALTGNGQIVAKVAAQQNTRGAAQAGVMIRETLDATSKHAATVITPGSGVLFQRRLATGGATSQTVVTGVGIVAPYWLKLVRSGNTVTGYYMISGGAWTRLGSNTFLMGANVLIGIAVSSGTNATDSTATFTNLNLGPKANAGPDQTVALPNSANFDGAATDDGLPAGSLKFAWRKVSGPGQLLFPALIVRARGPLLERREFTRCV